MLTKLVRFSDKSIIASIHQMLKNNCKKGQVNIQKNIQNFQETHKNNQDQYVYGVLYNKGIIILICSVFIEYKLSRGLSQIYHIENIYKNCNKQQQIFFQQKIVSMLPGYKIMGLNVIQSNVFHPYQTYMEFDVALPQKTKSKL